MCRQTMCCGTAIAMQSTHSLIVLPQTTRAVRFKCPSSACPCPFSRRPCSQVMNQPASCTTGLHTDSKFKQGSPSRGPMKLHQPLVKLRWTGCNLQTLKLVCGTTKLDQSLPVQAIRRGATQNPAQDSTALSGGTRKPSCASVHNEWHRSRPSPHISYSDTALPGLSRFPPSKTCQSKLYCRSINSLCRRCAHCIDCCRLGTCGHCRR